MLFGQSVFQSVLTRLKEEEKDEVGDTPASAADFRIRGLGAGFVAPPAEPPASMTDANLDAYFAYLPDDTAALAEQVEANEPERTSRADKETPNTGSPEMPPHLARLSEAEIAEELAISDKDTQSILTEKRRRFAKLNHPDRVAPQFRESATTRMTIANLMIDQAIRDLFWR